MRHPAPQPSTYDAATNSRYWDTRPVRVTARLLRIGLEFGGWAAADRLRGLRMGDGPSREAAAAESLKDVLVGVEGGGAGRGGGGGQQSST